MESARLIGIEDGYLYVSDGNGAVYKLKLEKYTAEDWITFGARYVATAHEALRVKNEKMRGLV